MEQLSIHHQPLQWLFGAMETALRPCSPLENVTSATPGRPEGVEQTEELFNGLRNTHLVDNGVFGHKLHVF